MSEYYIDPLSRYARCSTCLSCPILPGPVEPVGTLNVLSLANEATQSVAQGAPLTFNTQLASAGTAITHTQGSGIITLNRPGVYSFYFMTDMNNTVGPYPQTISAALEVNGMQIPIAAVSRTVEDAEPDNASFYVVLQVSQHPVNVRVVNLSTNAQYTNSVFVVQRLG